MIKSICLAAFILFLGAGLYLTTAIKGQGLKSPVIELTVINNNDSGAGSLRQSVSDASPGDTIAFDPGVTGTITLTSGQIDLNKNVTITGPGANALAISGNDVSRVFVIMTGVTANISGITVRNGDTNAEGGGIRNNAGGTLNLTNSAVINNHANGGGGIWSAGTSTVSDTTISGNSANFDAGGFYNFGNNATSNLINTTISSNTGISAGLGNGSGGAGNSASLTLTNCTVTANTGNAAILSWTLNGAVATTQLRNTIFAGNSGDNFATETGASVNSLGFALDSDGTSGLTNGVNGDIVGTIGSPVDVMLGPLSNNGGSTLTHALLAGSPAIDQGHNSGSTTDQRGSSRPVDLTQPNAAGGDGTDMGALEVQAGPLANFAVTNTDDSGVGSLRQAMSDSNASPGVDTITFNISGPGVQTITPLSPLPTLTGPVILDGTTQPGFAGTPIIELNGENAGPSSGLDLAGGNSVVRGLVVNRFAAHGIYIQTNGGNVVEGNFVGTDPGGTLDLGNQLDGVVIVDTGNNRIGGSTTAERNLLSGNNGAGVSIVNPAVNGTASGNDVRGNYIGTTITGAAPLGNFFGVFIGDFASGNTIGGAAVETRNVISGNGTEGVNINAGATSNIVQNNYIGLNAAGNAEVGNNIGVAVSSSGNSILSNVVSGNRATGVQIAGPLVASFVRGNLIGTDASGSVAVPNAGIGVVLGGTSGSVVGGSLPGERNVISGNGQAGVEISGAGGQGNSVIGNYIGTNLAGTSALANNGGGIGVFAGTHTIGGVTAGARNVISGNTGNGIYVFGLGNSSVIQGNYIGVDATGSAPIANLAHGILVDDSANNLIGGMVAGTGNVISGNILDGIHLSGILSSNNAVQGNQIGTNAAGTFALMNGDSGILISSSGNLIGGTVNGAGNLISGNGRDGIFLIDTRAFGNNILGNYIGTDINGTAPVPNARDGIFLFEGPFENTVGGAASGSGNTIAFNGRDGVSVHIGTGNHILGNSIFSNGTGVDDIGIELEVDGVHLNDPGDSDTGANNLQNYPLLNFVSNTGGNTTIYGSLNSVPNTTFRIEFFGNAVCDASGNGEGKTFLGSSNVVTDGSGDALIAATIAALNDDFITSTATLLDIFGNPKDTSEFSACLSATDNNEDPGPGCTYTASPGRVDVAVSGGTYFYDVLTQPGCPPGAVPPSAGTIYDGLTYSGGRVTFNVLQNNGSGRQEQISVGGTTFTIDQCGTGPPGNDNFVNAANISGANGTHSDITSNSAATAESGEPAHAGATAERSAWYSWTGPANGLYSFSTSGSSFDTVMAIYACPATMGSCAFTDLIPIGSNDDTTFFDLSSKVNFRADAGTTYKIAVDGKNGATGTIELSWRQYERLFRLYLQNYNGDQSPIVPDSVTASNGSNTVTPTLVSQGVYEFNLPADNTVYLVTITGPVGIVWDPNNFPLDTSTQILDELMEGPSSGTQNSVSNAQNQTPRYVYGYIRPIAAAELPDLSVIIGSSRGPNPRDAAPCTPLGSTIFSSIPYATYQCLSQPQTLHDIVPQMSGKQFTVSVLSFKVPINNPYFGVPTSAFVATNVPTYSIAGRVLAGGAGTLVDLSYIPAGNNVEISLRTRTDSMGGYSFNHLPPNTYRLKASRQGLVFVQPPEINLQNDQTIDISAEVSCTYTPEGLPTVTPAGGAGQFSITTNNETCEWRATSDAPWIVINSGATVGTGPVHFTVEPNSTESLRTGTIRITDRPDPITIRQATSNSTPVTVGGRVLSPSGNGLRGTVSITGEDGVRRTVTANMLGIYIFQNVASNAQYTIAVTSKRFRFGPKTMQITTDISNVDFFGVE